MASRRSAKRDADWNEGRTGCLGPHIVIVTLLLFGIFYAATLLAARTDGFRSYAQDKLESVVGMPMRVERVRATPALSVILEKVSCADGLTAGRPGIQAGKVVVAWSLGGLFKKNGSAVRAIEIQDVYLSLGLNDKGSWEPASVAAFAEELGSWLGVEIPKQTDQSDLSRLMGKVPLTLEEGRIVWWDGEGEVAQISGIAAESGPVSIGRREVLYRRVTAEGVAMRGRQRGQNVEVEFLRVGDRTITL